MLSKYDKIRNIENISSMFETLNSNLVHKSKPVMDAIIGYIRGQEVSPNCIVYVREIKTSPIFERCVILYDKFGDKYANCIYLDQTCKEEEL